MTIEQVCIREVISVSLGCQLPQNRHKSLCSQCSLCDFVACCQNGMHQRNQAQGNSSWIVRKAVQTLPSNASWAVGNQTTTPLGSPYRSWDGLRVVAFGDPSNSTNSR